MKKQHANYCPVAGMLNIVGDRWVWLIIREAFYGASRFSEFQRNIGIAKNLLSDRLSHLVNEGILERNDIGENGTRYAYHLTEKGRSLETVMIAMLQWGNAHLYEDGQPPVEIFEHATGDPIKPVRLESSTGRTLRMSDLAVVPGPSASKATRERLANIPNKNS